MKPLHIKKQFAINSGIPMSVAELAESHIEC